MEKIWETRSMLGEQVFNFTDDVFLLPSGQVLGYGDWGLIDYWRRAKPDLWHVKKAHTPIKIQDGPIPLPGGGRPLEVPVENRYDFTDLSEVRIEWSLGDESSIVQAHVPPHGKGTIAIRPSGADLNGKTLSLNFFRNDLMVDAYKLPIGKPAETASIFPSIDSGGVELAQTKETIIARGDDFEWVISHQTGEIVKATRKSQLVLVGGPVLVVLPVKSEPMVSGYPDPRISSYSPFNATCREWKATSVSARQSAGAVEIIVVGQYKEAAGMYTFRIAGDGDATVSYRFTYADAEKITPQQVGSCSTHPGHAIPSLGSEKPSGLSIQKIISGGLKVWLRRYLTQVWRGRQVIGWKWRTARGHPGLGLWMPMYWVREIFVLPVGTFCTLR